MTKNEEILTAALSISNDMLFALSLSHNPILIAMTDRKMVREHLTFSDKIIEEVRKS